MDARCSTSNVRRAMATKGEGGVGDRLVGGRGTLATSKPIRTVGSYWPYAPTLFDYIRRAMPQNAPQSLSNEDVYAVSAYILNLNGLLPADATPRPRRGCDQNAEPRQVRRRPRPDVKNPECMANCGGSESGKRQPAFVCKTIAAWLRSRKVSLASAWC